MGVVIILCGWARLGLIVEAADDDHLFLPTVGATMLSLNRLVHDTHISAPRVSPTVACCTSGSPEQCLAPDTLSPGEP